MGVPSDKLILGTQILTDSVCEPRLNTTVILAHLVGRLLILHIGQNFITEKPKHTTLKALVIFIT